MVFPQVQGYFHHGLDQQRLPIPFALPSSTPLVTALTLWMKECRLKQVDLTQDRLLPPLLEHNAHNLILKDNEQYVGVLTAHDLIKAVLCSPLEGELTLADLATSYALSIASSQSFPYQTAISLFDEHQIYSLPLINENKEILGIITPEFLLDSIAEQEILQLESVTSCIQKNVWVISPRMTLLEVAFLMVDYSIHSVIIAEGNTPFHCFSLVNHQSVFPLGIITPLDILQAYYLGINFSQTQAQMIMSCPPLIMPESSSLWASYLKAREHSVQQLLICDSRRNLLGVVHLTRLLKAMTTLDSSLSRSTMNDHFSSPVNGEHSSPNSSPLGFNILEQQIASKLSYHSTNLILVCHLDGTIMTVNPAWEKITGYHQEEIQNQSIFLEFILAEEQEKVKQIWQNIIQLKTSQENALYHWKNKDNQALLIRWNHTLLLNSEGLPDSILMIGVNMTEKQKSQGMIEQLTRRLETQKEINKHLQDSEEQLRYLIENHADGILIMNQDGKLLFINKIAEVLFGRKREVLINQIVGLPLVIGESTLVHICRPNGELCTSEMRVAQIVWKKEKAFLASLKDVTEQENHHRSFLDSEQRFRETFEQIAVGIAHLDIQGYFLRVNSKFANILNYQTEEMITHNYLKTLSLSEQNIQKKLFKKLVQKEELTFQRTAYFLTKEKSPIVGKVTVSLVWNDLGLPNYFVLILEDITQVHLQARDLSHFTENLKQLHRLTLSFHSSLDHLLDDYLKTGCQLLHIHHGGIFNLSQKWIYRSSNLTNVEPDLWVKVQSICLQILQQKTTVINKDNDLNCSFIGVPILVHQSLYGVLIFFSEPLISHHFPIYEQEIIELMAKSISSFLEVHQTESERTEALDNLRKNQYFVQRITQATPNILFIYDCLEQKLIYSNRDFQEVLGYTPMGDHSHPVEHHSLEIVDRVNGTFLEPFIHPQDLPAWVEHWQKLENAKEGEVLILEYRLQQEDQTWQWWMNHDVVFSRTDEGKPQQILGTMINIDRQKQAEELAKQANEQLHLSVKELQQHNREITLLGEMSEMLQACLSPEEAYATIGILVEPLFPNSCGAIYLLNPESNLMSLMTQWGNCSENETFFAPHQCWALRRGRLHESSHEDRGLSCSHTQHLTPPYHTFCLPMMAQGEILGLFYLCFYDAEMVGKRERQLATTVTEHISLAVANLQLRETLHHQSICDPLTGLYNRRYLNSNLEQALQEVEKLQKPLSLILMDIDHFKLFNDRFGHDIGDLVLTELGHLLRETTPALSLTCRYGGEEFLVVLPDTPVERAEEWVNRFREQVRGLSLKSHQQDLGEITLSVGIATCPQQGYNMQRLIQSADRSLYQAKAKGRDCVVISQ